MTDIATESVLESEATNRVTRRSGFQTLHEVMTGNAIRSYDDAFLESAKQEFSEEGLVILPKFLNVRAISLFQRELQNLQEDARRRDFEMPGYNTPRNLSVLSGQQLSENSPLILSLYFHFEVRKLIETIASQKIFSCTHKDEFLVANLLDRPGDTHGWHIDDPAYALVVCIKAPRANAGGEIEYIPGWTERCLGAGRAPDRDMDDLIRDEISSGSVKSRRLHAGDAYLLYASQNLHRVKPLTEPDTCRWVINLGFQDKEVQAYGATADALYGA